MLVDAPSVHCRSINEARFRVERRMRPIFATARRGPHLYRLASAQLLANVGLDRSAGLIVNMSRPIHLLKRIRSDQLAGDAVYHIKEAVPVSCMITLRFWPEMSISALISSQHAS